MNKTKIEWTDLTWNPITGCLNGCYYENHNVVGVVEWSDHCGFWELGADSWSMALFNFIQNENEFEVIGNQYEHPHLLGGESNV